MTCEASEKDGKRGYRFAGQGTYEPLLVKKLVPTTVVTPGGIRHLWPCGKSRIRAHRVTHRRAQQRAEVWCTRSRWFIHENVLGVKGLVTST
jgi:hypothetical protein